jgi:hypothetical protein
MTDDTRRCGPAARLSSVLALLVAAGCSANFATVERLDDGESNPYTPPSWGSGDVELTDHNRLRIWRAGSPPVSVTLELCDAGFDRSGEYALNVDDGTGCKPQVLFTEDVTDCDHCDNIGELVMDAILDAIIGRQHRWGSDSGTATVRNEAGVATVSIEADMQPRGLAFGENTARGSFELRVDAVLTDLSVDD